MKKIIYSYTVEGLQGLPSFSLEVLSDGQIAVEGCLRGEHRFPIEESLNLTRALQSGLGICDHGCEVPCPDCGCGC